MNNNTNRGTGAGGANTNKSGKYYETKVDIETTLLNEYNFYKIKTNSKLSYIKKTENKNNIYYFKQGGLKKFLEQRGKTIYRNPYMAVVKETNDNKHLIIFEVKNQTVSGSVDTKLWSGYTFRREYQKCLGEEYTIDYIFILSDYFKLEFEKNPKFQLLSEILEEQNINVIFGSDDDYLDKITKLIIN